MAYDPDRGLADHAGLGFRIVGQGGTADPAAPLVVRARAGECLKVVLHNRLPEVGPRLDDQRSDLNDGQGMLPRIVGFNAERLTPSRRASLVPQLIGPEPTLDLGLAAGFNGEWDLQAALPGRRDEFFWYAGLIHRKGCGERRLDGSHEPACFGKGRGAWYLEAEPRELGVAGLSSGTDLIEQTSQGLIGALIVEPADAEFLDPATGVVLATPPAGLETIVHSRSKGRFREFVVLYQDGLGLRARRRSGGPTPVSDCPICDDSYDLGEKGANYRSAPFWLRLANPRGTTPAPSGAELANLNEKLFPPNFLIASGTLARGPAFGPVPGPLFRAEEGEKLVFRVAEPAGRARQRVFTLLGHDYPDLGMKRFGSANTGLVGPGKTHNITIDRARLGYWLWRDGPAFMFSGGTWGVLEVRPKDRPGPEASAGGGPGAG
jgi:hypothetical protein